MLPYEKQKIKDENKARRANEKQYYDNFGKLKTIPWQNGFAYGRGILKEGVANPMVRELITQSHAGTTDQHTFYEMIYSLEDVRRVSNLDAEAVFPYGPWSIKAMVGYSRELKLESNYLYCMMGTTYVSAAEQQQYKQGNLTQEALRHFKTGDLLDFEKIFGAHFTSGHAKGATFLGRVIIKMQSTEDAQAIRAELGAQALFNLLGTGLKGNSKIEKRLASGTVDFDVVVQGLSGFECSARTIAEMQETHALFNKQITNHPEKLGPILAYCESVERALPFVFNFTNEGLSGFKTALQQNIEQLTNKSIALGNESEECEYEDFYDFHKKTRTFFELDPYIKAEVANLPKETQVTIKSRNIQMPYKESEIKNRTYHGVFIPQWGAGLYESEVEIRFSGPRRNHPDTVHMQEIIATQIKWLERLQALVTKNAYVGVSVEKISLYLAFIILKMMSSQEPSKLYGLNPDDQPIDDTGNSLFTAIAVALNKINLDAKIAEDSSKGSSSSSSQNNKTHATATSIRANVVNFMRQNEELKAHIREILKRDNAHAAPTEDKQRYASVEDYLQDMAKTNVPATHIELAALPYSLEHPVVLITPGNAYDKMLIHEDFANNTPLFIKFTNGQYQALHVPCDKDARDILSVIRDVEFEREHPSIHSASSSSSASNVMNLNSLKMQMGSIKTNNNNLSRYYQQDPNNSGLYM